MHLPLRKRTAVLISGRGSNMRSLVEAAARSGFHASIDLVLSNRGDAEGLIYARDKGIATEIVDHKAFATRQDFEAQIDRLLQQYNIELVCLAGFMRVLTAPFVQKWQRRLINIHPALLPSYRGLHTHQRALADGVKIHGCSVHFVVPEMDEGPIIAQAAVNVRDDDTEDRLGARVLAQEHIIYPLALDLLAADRLIIEGNRVRIDGAHAQNQFLRAPDHD
jgi:phosphoribosylglycinamide formyltransferase-1